MIRIITFFVLISNLLFSQTELQKAISSTLSIHKHSNSFEYLYFTIELNPNFYDDELVDVYYSITYNEIGTQYPVEWVYRYDGHLINISKKIVNQEIKGPFGGLREVRYQFSLELIDDYSSPYGKAVKILIFSSNPQKDAEYFNSYYDSPYIVTATYYDYSIGNTILDVYSHLSTLYTIYNISKSSNPTMAIVTSAIEYIILISIKNYINNQPIIVDIKNTKTGEQKTITRYNLDEFTFDFPGDERKIAIRFISN